MSQGTRRGLDYTPLFRFLISKVGEEWSLVYQEPRARLDREGSIFWLVARSDAEKKPFVRCGESTYYSGLFVDPQGRLARVDRDLTNHDIEP